MDYALQNPGEDLAVLPQQPVQQPVQPTYAVQPPTAAAATPDVSAYLAANPDLAENWNNGGILHQMGDTLEQAAARHYQETGQYEIANGGRNNVTPNFAVPAPTPAKSGMVTDPSMPNAVEAPSTATSGLPTLPLTQPLPQGMSEPQLMPANGKFASPYYAVYTNDGDFTGAIMANPGQKIRLVDGKTGEVVYEGTGPEGARLAAATANAVSQDKGRKAAWKIEADYGDQGWVAQGEDLKDKKNNLLGKLADIALPILGAALMPVTGGMSAALAAGLGAAGGSAVSSLAQGRNLKNTLLRAGLAGVGGYVAPGISNAIGSAIAPTVAQGALSAGTQAAAQAGTQAATQAATQAGSNLVSEVIVNGVRTLVPAAVASGIGAAGGAALGGALSSSGGSNTLQGNAGGDNIVSPVEVTAATPNALPSAAGAAIGALSPDFAGSAVDAATGPNQVDELVVTGMPQTSAQWETAAAVGGAGLIAALQSGPAKVKDWVKANPTKAALLGLGIAGLFGGSGDKTGQYGIPGGGVAGAGTRESLGPTFSASLPAPTFAVRSPRDMSGTDWKRYAIAHPEQSFFTDVPQALGPRAFAVGGHVSGEGDGRSDSIDAKLSDGEYVVDSETVSLLGNGSTKAGARKLDSMRVNLRKHKGKSLSRGRFSVAARDPESYIKGTA